jgi:lipopolysaccharide/colanic/teichoic acid biosynthesis glycosyltransferase
VPQLLNILRGDMGIVGPRPMVPCDIDFLPEEVQRKAYSVRPGLTGLGSIAFRDEEKILSVTKKPLRQCYCEDIAPLKADMELWYVDRRSIKLDFEIIFHTAWVILFPKSKMYQKIFGPQWAKFEPRFKALYDAH